MQKKIHKLTFFAVMCVIALVFAFYAKGSMLPGKSENHIFNKSSLLDPMELMSFEQKMSYVQKLNDIDRRPVAKEAVKVKGIYMSGRVFSSPLLFNNLLSLVEQTELNALVIDVKDDDGSLAFQMKNDEIRNVKARTYADISSAEKRMVLLDEKDVFPIARIVVFKDPKLAEAKPELAIRRSDGTIWRDRQGLAWVDPHNREVWKYAVDVAKEAAKLGFREIQFDYVRFPTDGNLKNAIYPFATGDKKEDVIKEFLAYARTELEPYNVFLSADVFGLTTLTIDGMGMGQKFEKIIEEVDYVCPMVYPSHYGSGNYGFANPNAYPFEIVKNALRDGLKKSTGQSVVIRPWLQDFSLGIPKYGIKEVRAQIDAVYEVGLDEWLLWNAGNRYTVGALER